MLRPGHGTASAWLGLRSGQATGGVDVEARLSRMLAAYASAEARWAPGNDAPDWNAIAGARLRW